jgi:hypothetical protein
VHDRSTNASTCTAIPRVRERRLGFKATAHQFQQLVTDLLNKNGFNPDAIERQLDHVQQNRMRAAYLRSNFMSHRVTMMQWITDWADAQRDESHQPLLPDNVVALGRVAKPTPFLFLPSPTRRTSGNVCPGRCELTTDAVCGRPKGPLH